MKILLVTDSDSVQKTTEGYLRERDNLILECAGKEQEARHLAQDVKVMIIDWDCSVIQPGPFMKQLQENQIFLPTIALSSQSDKQTIMETIFAGARYFIRKPFSKIALWDKIQIALNPEPLTEDKGRTNDVEYLFRHTQELLKSKEYRSALSFIDRAIELESHYALFWQTRGDIYSQMGNYGEAEKNWLKAEQMRKA